MLYVKTKPRSFRGRTNWYVSAADIFELQVIYVFDRKAEAVTFAQTLPHEGTRDHIYVDFIDAETTTADLPLIIGRRGVICDRRTEPKEEAL